MLEIWPDTWNINVHTSIEMGENRRKSISDFAGLVYVKFSILVKTEVKKSDEKKDYVDRWVGRALPKGYTVCD